MWRTARHCWPSRWTVEVMSQGMQPAPRSWKRQRELLPRVSVWKPVLLTPWFCPRGSIWTSYLQNCHIINLWHLNQKFLVIYCCDNRKQIYILDQIVLCLKRRAPWVSTLLYLHAHSWLVLVISFSLWLEKSAPNCHL